MIINNVIEVVMILSISRARFAPIHFRFYATLLLQTTRFKI